jgi:hypothetical protein
MLIRVRIHIFLEYPFSRMNGKKCKPPSKKSPGKVKFCGKGIVINFFICLAIIYTDPDRHADSDSDPQHCRRLLYLKKFLKHLKLNYDCL